MACSKILVVVTLLLFISCGYAQLLPQNVFRFLDVLDSNKPHGVPTMPPYTKKALTARYVVHTSDWGSLATISVQKKIAGMPYANVFSIADGIIGNVSLGIPYFFMTGMDVSTKDLEVNAAATLVVSEAQSDTCKKQDLDPENPVCARAMLTGIIEKVVDPSEIARAKQFLYTRHPEMADWPSSHGWFFSKLNIKQIQLLDFYGGIYEVPLSDYFSADLYVNF